MLDDWENPESSQNLKLPSIFDEAIEVVVRDEHELAPGAVETMFTPGEAIFGAVAAKAAALGWRVFPQKKDGRGPSRVDGRALAWGFIKERAPTSEEIRWWSAQCRSENCAAVMGHDVGDGTTIFCLDIDVLEPRTAEKVIRLARIHLGRSRFERQGRAPKLAIFYRKPMDLRLPSLVRLEQTYGGEAQAIEVLQTGKAITIYGNHHKTGDYFRWYADQPILSGPETAPLVTGAQWASFMAALRETTPLAARAPTVESSDEIVPLTYSKGADGVLFVDRITVDGQAYDSRNRMRDQRERCLYQTAWDVTRLNAALVHRERTVLEEGCKLVAARLTRELDKVFDWSVHSSNFDRSGLFDEALKDVRGIAVKLALGDAQPIREKTATTSAVIAAGDVHPSLAWIRPKTLLKLKGKTSADPARAAELAILYGDAARAHMDDVSARVEAAIRQWLWSVVAWTEASGEPAPAWLLRAPTGAGKTTTLIRIWTEVVAELRAQGRKVKPLLVLMPAKRNVAEALAKDSISIHPDDPAFEPAETDEAWAAQEAAASGGLRTMVFRGKVEAGCKRRDAMELAQTAGLGGAGLCRARVKQVDGSYQEEDCPFRAGCEAFAQRRRVAEVDLILSTHAYLHVNLPVELKEVVGVVVDEKAWDNHVHATQLQLSSLKRPRIGFGPREKDKENRLDADSMLDARAGAVKLLVDALKHGKDPRVALATGEVVFADGSKISGAYAVEICRTICGQALNSRSALTPTMTDLAVAQVAGSPKAKDLAAEFRLWSVLEEGVAVAMRALRHAEVGGPRVEDAIGAHDARLHFFQREGTLRISWRSTPNLADRPILWMDASGEQALLAKVWGREVTVREVTARQRMLTVWCPDDAWAKTGVMHVEGDDDETRYRKSRKLALLRAAEVAIATAFPGGMTTCSVKDLRRARYEAWAPPSSVTPMHYNATAGLDFAKDHAAAFAIGRIEIPWREVDGLVAALSYDDKTPEDLLDPNGNGKDHKGKPLKANTVDRAISKRDGARILISVPEHAGHWAWLVQRQAREENVRQYAGRLRPVYREGEPPVLVYAGKTLPEDIVVDVVCGLEDLVLPGLDHARRAEGAVCAGLHEAVAGWSLHDRDGAQVLEALEPIADRMSEVQFRVGADERRALVPAWAGDPSAAVATAAAYTEVPIADVRVVRHVQAPAHGVPTSPDDLEVEAGGRGARMVAEWDTLLAALAGRDDDGRIGGIPVDVALAGRALHKYRIPRADAEIETLDLHQDSI